MLLMQESVRSDIIAAIQMERGSDASKRNSLQLLRAAKFLKTFFVPIALAFPDNVIVAKSETSRSVRVLMDIAGYKRSYAVRKAQVKRDEDGNITHLSSAAVYEFCCLGRSNRFYDILKSIDIVPEKPEKPEEDGD